MTVNEVLAIMGVYTVIHIVIIGWLNSKVDSTNKTLLANLAILTKDVSHAHDEIRKDHNTLSTLLAGSYMDKDNTMQMYGIMSQATEQKVDAVFKKVDTMNDKLDQVLMLMADKK